MSRNEGRFSAAEGSPTPEDEGTSAVAASAAGSQFNWALPTEFVELPSKGKYYPPGHPLHNQATVEIKYMTAKEEDILTDRALLKKGIAIDRVLENLIVNKAIKLDDLLVGDKNAILVKARTTGYGSSYDTRVICPNCLTPCEHSFDLEELGHIDFEQSLEDDEVELTESNTFRVTLPMSKVTIECRMLTGGDESSIAKKALRNDRKNEASTTLTTQLGMLIVSINDNTDKFTKAKFIAAMPARDSRYLRGILEKVTPNIDMTQDFECEHCGEQAVLEVPLNTDFFWPK
mgnify:CR=1 FL=1|jgi:hypothetical protein|tara:strand:- start:458 stop:1324 length:867 start_codon:yes stop_codon:yes gene_type:complete